MHINTNALIFHVSRFFQEVPDKEKNATKIGFPDFDELDDFFHFSRFSQNKKVSKIL